MISKETLKKGFEKLLLKKPDKFIVIFFNPGMGGSALLRILISHDELYHSFKNLAQPDYDDPLKYPDSIEGFYTQKNDRLSFKEQHLACTHLTFHTPWNDNYEDLKEYFNLIKQNKKIVLKTHDFSMYEKCKKSKCIFIIGDSSFKRDLNCPYGNPSFLPKNIIKVDISKLMSTNYDTFLLEYLKLVQEFNLTPKVNSVRAFILMWLERQERLKKTLS